MRIGPYITVAAMCLGLALAPQTAAAQQKVTIAISLKALSFAPIYLAADGGAFAKHGITPDIVVTAGGVQPVAALIAGDAQFAAGANDILMAMASTRKVIAIYAFNNSFTQEINVRKQTVQARGATQAMPWRDRIRRLKGITMGVLTLGGSSDLAGRYLWKESGLDPENDMTIVKIGALPALVSAMKQGSIDSFVLSSPARELVENQQIGEALVRFAEVEAWQQDPNEIILVRREFTTENPDLARRFVAAVAQAQKQIYDDPRGAAAVLNKGSFSEVEADLIASALDHMHVAFRQELMTNDRWSNARKSHASVNPKLENLTLQENVDWSNEFYPH